MNFDTAIESHAAWKMKLAAYLANPDHGLKASAIEVDDQCDLGKWLRGEGQKYSQSAEFSKLVSAHTQFHKAAAEVVRRADSGQNVKEEVALGARSEFAQASTAVVKALMMMKARA